MIDLQKFREDCLLIREQSPLVHNITNYVAMNFTANALLSIGASPLMSFCEEEMTELVRRSSALVVNIGCLDRFQTGAMESAALAALECGKPWVLDPAGAGASTFRTDTCMHLIEDYRPDIIRGNAAEIMVLSGTAASSRGVDSLETSSDAVDAARLLARTSKAVISVSGPTDYITDGTRVESIANGSPMMPRVTAMGCTATALTGAFAAVDDDLFSAALNAMAMMGTAGELAARCVSGEAEGSHSGIAGTGTMAVRFLDVLSIYDALGGAEMIRQ